MDRNRVLELAREAEILRQLSMEVPFVIDRLEQFAALIEREVRGDAEPVAWMYDFLNPDNREEVIRNWLTQDPSEIEHAKGFNVRPLYATAAPAVDAQAPTQWWDGEGNLTNFLWDTEALRPKGGLMIDPEVAAADCHTTFIGNNATEVLRISKEGIWANPDVPVDEIAHVVLSVLDNQIKTMVKKAVDAAKMEAK